ncbi:MAG: aromatic amino acid ammonia-lyase [Polyangiales bacterium]
MTATEASRAARTAIEVGAAPLTIDDIIQLAEGVAVPQLSKSARKHMQASADVVARLHEDEAHIYGVTTSVGASAGTHVPRLFSRDLSLNIQRMHGCGTGQLLSEEQTAAVLAVRLSSLSQGKSGIRPIVADRLIDFLDNRILPLIPSEGSVGASGDLTPLSYVAAALVGEREVRFNGEVVESTEAIEAIGQAPLILGPREVLALMNGTSAATAIACLAWASARRLSRLAACLTAMCSEVVHGNPTHFDAFVHEAKPHPGQVLAARWIREDLGYDSAGSGLGARLQDRYSIRCAPHVIGVALDSLRWSQTALETEFNGVSDNPLVDVAAGRVVHGGNFYGSHVGFACDTLKVAVANIACLMDRQLTLLCNPTENDGLPANLVGVQDAKACSHNGFKAVTIAASALAAEALKMTMPASAFSRSTEQHNQDKVPMATLAARDLARVVEITEQVAAMMTLACCQAVDLRDDALQFSKRASAVRSAVREVVPTLGPDRRMDVDIAAVLALLRRNALPLGSDALT